jgi:hypothetical protein
MSGLMTTAEALEEWPVGEFDDDTLGGMRREIILSFWQSAEEIRQKTQGTAVEGLAERWLSAVEARLVAGDERLDELQEEGLRTAFAHVMGYELP